MNIIKITISFNKISREKAEDEIECLFHSLLMEGYLLTPLNSIIFENEVFKVFSTTPDVMALERRIAEKKIKNITVSISSQGKDIWAPESCKCTKSSFYIFSGSYYTPLYCGDCNNFIPLYSIPFTYDPDPSFFNIISWNDEFNAWLKIEFNSTKEEIAQDQLSAITSNLNTKGMEISNDISFRTSVPTYYDLQEFRDAKKCSDEFARLCPKCNGEWLLQKTMFDEYDYKCDVCRLVSNFSHNLKEECRKKINIGGQPGRP